MNLPSQSPLGKSLSPQARKESKGLFVRLKNNFPTRKSHLSKTFRESRTIRSSRLKGNSDYLRSRERTDHPGRTKVCTYCIIICLGKIELRTFSQKEQRRNFIYTVAKHR
jgi:hypothetical protein